MLRSLAAVTFAALILTSCGDDNNHGSAAAPPATNVTGTVLGQSFTAADASAAVLSRTTCEISGFTASATGILIGFSSFPGLCAFVTETRECGLKADSTAIAVLVARGNIAGGSASPVQPGTYTIGSIPAPDAQGNLTLADAGVERTGALVAQCLPRTTQRATGGTVRIDSVGAQIAGSVDVTFPGGGRISGTFSTPACAFQPDVCAVLSGDACAGARICVP